MSFFSSLLGSTGVKRMIASVLTALSGIVATIPQLAFLAPTLANFAAGFGVAGLGNAAVKGTVQAYAMPSLTSVFAVLIAAAQYIPALKPWAPILQQIATLLGVATVARTF